MHILCEALKYMYLLISLKDHLYNLLYQKRVPMSVEQRARLFVCVCMCGETGRERQEERRGPKGS